MDWLREGDAGRGLLRNAELRITNTFVKDESPDTMTHTLFLSTILFICLHSNLTFCQSPDSSTYFKLKQINNNAKVYYAYARFNDGSLEYEGWIQDQDSMETKYGRWRHYYKSGQVWRIEDKPIN